MNTTDMMVDYLKANTRYNLLGIGVIIGAVAFCIWFIWDVFFSDEF